MKLTSQTIAAGGSPRRSAVKRRASSPSCERDARIGCEARVELAMADVDGDDESRAARQQHVGEAARRRADVEAGEAARIERESVERRGELDARRARPRMRRARLDRGVGREGSDGLRTIAPSARTSPAAIAACARARLGKSPRSTSSRSARWRMAGPREIRPSAPG